MKRTLATLLALVLLLTTLGAMPFAAGAATLNEKEDNDYFDNANLIDLGSTMNAKTSADYDCDVFKVISNEAGKINLTFTNLSPNDVGSGGWIINILSPGLTSEYDDIAQIEVNRNNSKTVVLPFIGAKAGTYYYIIVAPGWGSMQGYSYQIKTSFTKGKYYEKEVNNTEAQATKYILKRDFVGYIGGDYDSGSKGGAVWDKDFYKITAPAKGKMSLTFKHKKNTAKTSAWVVTVYTNENGANRTVLQTPLYFKDNATTKLLTVSGVKKGKTYYAVVQSLWDPDFGGKCFAATDIVGEPYTLSSTFDLAAAPKVKAKATKNSVTLTSNKLADITGFEVQIKDGKKWKKAGTVKKKALKFTKKSLKKNKKYTFRVRAYLKKDGTDYYGKWVTVSAKTKKK